MSTKGFCIPIIPRLVVLGFYATRTSAGSTALIVTLYVWKVSVGISFHNYP